MPWTLRFLMMLQVSVNKNQFHFKKIDSLQYPIDKHENLYPTSCQLSTAYCQFNLLI